MTTTTTSALQTLSDGWFSSIKTRWIDVVGAYAGKELFLVDGDALIRHVLDDPLLRLGIDGSLDFQLLHAIFSAETFLHELCRRGAVLQVIFFESNRNTVFSPSASPWTIAARTLASKILRTHIEELDIESQTFESPEDPQWKAYVLFNKPLFILCHTGGVYNNEDEDESWASELLLRRYFISQMFAEGLFVASLTDIDYRDSQALTFLFDRRPYEVPEEIKNTIQGAYDNLDKIAEKLTTAFDSDAEEAEDLEEWPKVAIQSFVKASTIDQSLYLPVLWVFLAHTLLLDAISLDLRCQPEPEFPSGVVQSLTEQVLPVLFAALQSALPEELDGIPSVDGRIFSLLLAKHLEPNAQSAEILGSQTLQNLNEIWSSLSLSPVDFESFRSKITEPIGLKKPPQEFEKFPLYPFQVGVFTEVFDSLDVPVKGAEEEDATPEPLTEFDSNSIFRPARRIPSDNTTIPKHLGGDEGKPKDKRAREKLLRSNQLFMNNLERQAKSLTGAKGAPLEQEVITPVGLPGGKTIARPGSPTSKAGSRANSKAQSRSNSRKPQPSKGPGGKKGGKDALPMKSADKLRAQIEAQKKAKAITETETWWQQRLKELKDMDEVVERIETLELQLKNKRAAEDKSLAANMWMFRINLELWKWVEDPKRNEPAIKDAYVVRIVTMVKNVGAQYGSVLTPTMVKDLWSVLEGLGFEDYVEMVPRPSKEIVDKKLPFDFIKLFKKAPKGAAANAATPWSYPWMRIREDPVDWQLRVFGEHMDRSFDSQPDERVKFEPDAWQREVLDKLDRDDSILVVAPTSAGKTFISYYAMKQVLTSSDDSILVYVAPTKPLVTQIAAEIYARYRKDMKGKSCWAVYQADQRINNPLTCQILVTVPEIFAHMLMTPSLARSWTPRIKRIILDEIHMLGSQKGGVWEHILLFATCPIIGLSATVGEAEVFNEWLKTVQEAHGHRHSLVQHKHRYSHLRKFSYILDDDPDPIGGLNTHKSSGQTRFLHPISFIRAGITELPDDLALEARDCATLYKAMTEESKDASLKALDPKKFFAKLEGKLLQQKDVIRYETALKAKLTEWLHADDAHLETSLIRRVVKRLSDPDVGTKESEEALSVGDPKLTDPFYTNLFNFLADLNASGDLPALLFNFDRYTVENMARALLERLKKDEAEWRKYSPEWEKRVKGWQAWESGSKEREKAAQRAALKTGKAEGDKMDRLQNAAAVDTSPFAVYANFDPDAPSEEFCFTSWSTRYSVNELEEDIKALERWTTTPRFLLECLRRGIAVHHAGLNKRYRALVESLFRIGFCKVVISTEDLALGVNMPAKASVFCGDSPALTALMYRQCAGRAGRRGFDLLGKVIFYGIPHERVRQVVLSRLPALRGNYPLTPTLSLRLINLLSESGFAPTAVEAVRALFKLPSLTVGSEISREQTIHQLRFATEYLIRSRVIDSEGTPLHPWYSLSAWLSTAEPANFALLALFRSGYLHSLCNDQEGGTIEAKRKLMHLLAYLFNRDFLSKSVVNETQIALSKTPSKVVLPPIDPKVRKILRSHNEEVLKIYTQFATTFAEQQSHLLKKDNKLPFSQQEVVATETSDSQFISGLQKSKILIESRSAFVATSGHGDLYGSLDELVRTVRSGIDMNKQVIPYLSSLAPSNKRENRFINAYLYDFFIHGQDNAIVNANRIPRGEIWYRLQEFSGVLASVVTSIGELIGRDGKKEEESRIDDEPTKPVSTSTKPTRSSSPVPDDWTNDLEKDEAVAAPVSSLSGGASKKSAVTNTGPIEKEKGDDVEAAAAVVPGREGDVLVKPAHVGDRDWRVYEVFVQLQDDFNQKFTAMWA